MAGRYPKKYDKLRGTLQKVRDWTKRVEKDFMPAMAADDIGKAKRSAQGLAKFGPYFVTQVVNDMNKIINERKTEMNAMDDKMKNANVLQALVKIANDLDDKGLHVEADLVTESIQSFAAQDSGSSHEAPAVKEYGYTDAPTLSIGTCPDHRGHRLVNIGEQTYQCTIDGKVYNWKEGFSDMSGNKYPGGSVDLQTPDSASWAEIPRWFEK